MGVCRLWLRSPVYYGQNVNAFAEAEVRAALISSLSSEVIQPLVDLKVRSLSFVRSVSYLPGMTIGHLRAVKEAY